MNPTLLILRSLAHHRRAHLGVAAGTAIAAAVLVGALAVGDSLRASLTEQALRRTGEVRLAMDTGERTFTASLAAALTSALATPSAPATAALRLAGVASADGGRRRSPDVRVYGVEPGFFGLGGGRATDVGEGRAIVNDALARKLGIRAGDTILLRVAVPSALPRDVPLGAVDSGDVTLTATVATVIDAKHFGDFDLRGDPEQPLNAFVALPFLEQRTRLAGQRNLVLTTASGPHLVQHQRGGPSLAPIVPEVLRSRWQIEDVGARLRRLDGNGPWDLTSTHVFLAEPLVHAALAAAPARSVLTYFVDSIEASNGRVSRYAMVSAYDPDAPPSAPPAPVPDDFAPDQIVVTRWLAEQLAVTVGDPLTLRYWVFGLERQLTRASARFTVARIAETDGPGGDRALMPQLPGLTDVESALDWDPAPELDIHPERLSPAERDYWRDHRGAPKAFVRASWARGAGGWRTPYGDATSVRLGGDLDESALRDAIRARLDPARVGLSFQPVRDEALRAVDSGAGSYFGYLFASLSAFVILAALLLTAVLFTFHVEERSPELGTLRAIGIPARRIRSWLVLEGLVAAAGGTSIGIPAGWLYAWLMVRALTAGWAGAVAGTALRFHVAAVTPAVGAGAVLVASALTIAWVVSRRARREPLALLAARFGVAEPGSGSRRAALLGAIAMGTMGVAMGVGGARADAETATGLFFGSGACVLLAACAAAAASLTPSAAARGATVTFLGLGWRGASRRPGRALAIVAMLASGTFLVISVNAFRLGGRAATAAGTGGFALFARTSTPVARDLSRPEGVAALGLAPLEHVRFIGLRLAEGDEASCRNLSRPRRPALLGVDVATIARRNPFRFTGAIVPTPSPWTLLAPPVGVDDGAVPAIVDEAVAKWVLGVGLGDTLDYVDEAGRPFQVRIVALLGGSILQGYVVIDAARFAARFPSSSGQRVFLVDAPAGQEEDVARALAESALGDHGLSVTPAAERLASFETVQNTYLSIFTAIGGLGLILGCAGLGIVVLRNVLERRGELAAMRAMGFTRRRLVRLLLVEHASLLAWGAGAGIVAAVVAVRPALTETGAVPIGLLTWACVGVVANGLVCTTLAARAALAGELLGALRDE